MTFISSILSASNKDGDHRGTDSYDSSGTLDGPSLVTRAKTSLIYAFPSRCHMPCIRTSRGELPSSCRWHTIQLFPCFPLSSFSVGDQPEGLPSGLPPRCKVHTHIHTNIHRHVYLRAQTCGEPPIHRRARRLARTHTHTSARTEETRTCRSLDRQPKH